MLDRIVPVHRTDLMSLYYFMVVTNYELDTHYPVAATAPGVFDLSSETRPVFLAEPAKKIKIGPSVPSIYFVPTLDYEGCTDAQGGDVSLIGEVYNDGATLHFISELEGRYEVAAYSLEHALEG